MVLVDLCNTITLTGNLRALLGTASFLLVALYLKSGEIFPITLRKKGLWVAGAVLLLLLMRLGKPTTKILSCLRPVTPFLVIAEALKAVMELVPLCNTITLTGRSAGAIAALP